ncbi:hypothetical protein BWQ96_01309 [Gracilariopsis chorda]|uniref:Uncharacterized protein n=1 Tax=Gracilariopsis chorda TaxID=448386 RepID=A0A2V3J4P6_9FLOR|nr:hypothetical protein BWQ96_01309 [Gracilariopsis chorda]|eukprot:PXF48967.1 hypothetical protein BWQ96_01309 [Gracilariopsis chorda]
MKSSNAPIVVVTLFVLLIVLLVSGQYTHLLPQLTLSDTDSPEQQFLSHGSSLSSPHTCVIYDRPPRTASTTIGNALEKCLEPLGYEQPDWQGMDGRSLMVLNMLRLPFERVSLLARHFYMNSTSLLELRTGCDALFYITSTAPMKERLWSLVKYRQVTKHGNSSLNETQLFAALQDLRKETVQIEVLNAYPYLQTHETPINRSTIDTITPDYVIRKSQLNEDMSKLLRAFGCETRFVSENIHLLEHASGLDKITIDDDDGLHERMLRLARQRNDVGLKKAADFAR